MGRACSANGETKNSFSVLVISRGVVRVERVVRPLRAAGSEGRQNCR